MESHGPTPNALFTYAIVALVVVRYLVRELRDRTMKVGRLFVAPAILSLLALAFAAGAAVTYPSTVARVVLLTIGGVAAGVVAGLAIARLTTVRPAATPASVIVRGSRTTVGIWLAVLALRFGARALVPASHVAGTAELNIGLVGIVAAALFTVRFGIYRRAQTLAPARAALPVADS